MFLLEWGFERIATQNLLFTQYTLSFKEVTKASITPPLDVLYLKTKKYPPAQKKGEITKIREKQKDASRS